ncbi:MAG: M48 family metalloprotease [Caldimicrobium sp.]|nr:M48 family metalloprotease [Caldimicrobium sp.]MCX7873224.1 M48 family metalloprotease [Caldimicrobium sp.]MDW8094114.1 M48 family metalloprotease [Caldimicrobium sp.]
MKIITSLVLFLFILFFTFSSSFIEVNSFPLKLISEEREIELGKLYLPASIDEFEGIYPEEELQTYLNNLGKRLAQRAQRKMDYQFYLVNSNIVNAFALPGGPVIITRGIFLILEDEDELAGILSHEIGHIEKRHHARFVEKQLALNLLLQIGSFLLPQNLTGEILFQLSKISAGLISLKFSRDQEKEADEVAFSILIGSNYSPEGMLKVFEKLKKLEKSRPPEWLSTHPLPESRIKSWQEKIAQHKVHGSYLKSTSKFEEMKKMLLQSKPSFEEYEKGKKAFKERDFERAEKHFERALELYPKNVPALIYLARLNLKEKNYPAARDFAFRALKLNPELFSAHYLCGLSEFGLQNWERSLAYFEKAKKLVPFDGSTYYYAGRNLENLGRLTSARDNYQRALEIGPKDAPWYEDCFKRYNRLR